MRISRFWVLISISVVFMKLKEDEFITAIFLRAGILTRQRKRRKAITACCCIGVLCFSALVFHAAGRPLPAMSASVFLDNPGIGGYILTGVVSFTGGVIATLCSIRYQRKTKKESKHAENDL